MAPASKTKRFRIGPKPMTAEESNRWLDAQMPYANLAGNEEIAKNAREFVQTHADRFIRGTSEIREKWETLDYMLDGQTLSSIFPNSDLHVPLTYIALETLVPVLVDSLTNLDPWFQVHGRDRMDRRRAKRIQAWLMYQADLTKLNDRLEEIARTFLIYQFVALKSRWSVKHRKQVTRSVERSVEKGFPVYEITPEDGEVKYYEGNEFHIVDPYLFFCDTRETDPQKMQFIGDIQYVSEEEVIRLGNQGVYMNVDEVVEKLRNSQATLGGSSLGALGVQTARDNRSMETEWVWSGSRAAAKGQPNRLEIVEVWCTWRPTPEDDYDEYVITTCGKTVLRVQKNFHDDKHRPYAIARAAKRPFDFFNVGVLDNAIRLNMEVDDHRNLARKSHQLALCPHVWVGPDSDMPSNLFDLEPGQVFRGSTPPSFGKVGSTVAEMIPFEQVLRRDIEQATGSFGAFEGGTDSNTATEYERKVQLRNLRNRRLVFAFSDGLKQLLEHFYANTLQFVTARQTFRVLGSQASALSITYEINPEDFRDPVDIILTGPSRLQSYGLRATQVMTWMQQVAPLIPMAVQNGDLNVPALLMEMWESIVGYRLGEDILSTETSADEAVNPENENLSLLTGGGADVHPLDDDALHIQVHMEALAEADGDQTLVRAVMDHVSAHIAQQQAKAAREKAAAGGPSGPFKSGNALGSRHQTQDGRESQRTPDLMADVTRQTPPGETPGPPRMGGMASPDRNPSVPQTQNR